MGWWPDSHYNEGLTRPRFEYNAARVATAGEVGATWPTVCSSSLTDALQSTVPCILEQVKTMGKDPGTALSYATTLNTTLAALSFKNIPLF